MTVTHFKSYVFDRGWDWSMCQIASFFELLGFSVAQRKPYVVGYDHCCKYRSNIWLVDILCKTVSWEMVKLVLCGNVQHKTRLSLTKIEMPSWIFVSHNRFLLESISGNCFTHPLKKRDFYEIGGVNRISYILFRNLKAEMTHFWDWVHCINLIENLIFWWLCWWWFMLFCRILILSWNLR